ncbi:MAG: HEAT repeat domain-containing protein [Nitrospinota bacterium]
MTGFSSKNRLDGYLLELKNPDPEVRRRAAYNLSNLEDSSAVPHLINALSDKDRRVRWRVAYTLGDFGEMGSNEAFEALVSHLKAEPDWNVRRIIVMAFRHWGKRAIPPLIRALSDESEYVRRYAVMTLGFKKAKEAAPLLKKLATKDPSKIVRDYSKWALNEIVG